MKTYTQLDKIVINKIIELYLNNNLNTLMNVLFDINSSVYGLTSSFYFSSNEPNSVIMNIHEKYYNKLGVHDLREFIPGTINTMSLIIRLIKYLEENDYLLVHPEKWDFKLGINDADSAYITYEDFNPQLKEDIYIIGISTFIPTEKMLILQKNAFLDEESLKEKSIKYQNTMTNRLSIATLILSIISLITSTIIGYIALFK